MLKSSAKQLLKKSSLRLIVLLLTASTSTLCIHKTHAPVDIVCTIMHAHHMTLDKHCVVIDSIDVFVLSHLG